MASANAEDIMTSRRRFRPLLELGRGGMSRVYLVESLASGVRKLVVLKILERELAANQEMRAAFQREAELSARMNHPNVVQVFEVVEHTGVPVIVMEFLDGIALSRLVQGAGDALPLRLHASILCQMLAGLHHFHELKDYEGNSLHGVHRDVSPQNVMVLHDGIVKVVDFGIAKVNVASPHETRAGMIKGKIHYMPPEQLLGDVNIDRRVDIFAAGVMLWEAIAKRRMWSSVVENQVVRELANGRLPKLRDAVPDVPEALERVVERALSPEREGRYATALEMQLELEHAMAETDGHVHPRELSGFMHKHFGDRRAHQQRIIETALRNPVTSLSGLMDCVTPSADSRSSGARRIETEDDSLGLPILLESSQISDLPSSSSGIRTPAAAISVQPWYRSRALLVAIASAIVTSLLIALFSWRKSVPPPAPERAALSAPAPAPVKGAELGARLDPPAAETPQAAAAPVPAPAPAPAASSAIAEQEQKASPKVFVRAKRAAPAAPKVTGSSAAPAPPSGARSANCSPPFKLGADGVKIFKPECF